MKKLAVVSAVVLLLTAVLVTAGLYAGGETAYAGVPPHRHYILHEGGKVYVGPNFCDNQNPEGGFEQFHTNVHRGNPTLKAFENPNNPVQLLSESC